MTATDSETPSAHRSAEVGGKSDRQEELERALSEGEISELPANKPKGILGEVAPSLYRPESFEPDLNSGLSQENDTPVVVLAIVLSYVLFFPLAFVILWRTRALARRGKIVLTVVMAAGVLVIAWQLLGR